VKQGYTPHARTEYGIWALPNGDALYAAAVKEQTTTSLGQPKFTMGCARWRTSKRRC
jgi:uncharacterized protein (DUF885 family)